ncbi:unnamed protein product [Parnassius apollo]|uniref:(apollo) hypothetical protein n=1 Tax=Parnassius apollo TaxID=110799 RepID=A0A8S3XGX7_PARAO|nr:unnamed protein product [Parnassius apollo]
MLVVSGSICWKLKPTTNNIFPYYTSVRTRWLFIVVPLVSNRWRFTDNCNDFKSFLRAQADLLESLGSDRPDEQPEANGTRKALVIASSPGHGTSPKPSPKPKAHAVPAATAASTGLLAKMVSRLHRDPTTTYQVAELEGPSSLRGHDGGGEG